MSINLQKGQKIDLTKGTGGALRQVMVGLGWDEAIPGRNGRTETVDCDASAILCGADGKIVSTDIKQCCIFFGNLRHSSGAIVHMGDNLDGSGVGDCEQIKVYLDKVPSFIDKIVFVVNLYDARVKKQHFGLVRNAYIRLVNMDNNVEICRFNLSEDYNNMTGMIVGEIYRREGEWKFNAIGLPVLEASRLVALVRLYA